MGSSARGRPPFLVSLLAVLALVATACGGGGGQEASPSPEGKPLTFGMILVGPKNDHGWSQAHFEAGKYVEQQLGARMIVIDKVNPADRPETSVEQVVSDMIDQGAQLIFATSDDMKDGIQAAAAVLRFGLGFHNARATGSLGSGASVGTTSTLLTINLKR